MAYDPEQPGSRLKNYLTGKIVSADAPKKQDGVITIPVDASLPSTLETVVHGDDPKKQEAVDRARIDADWTAELKSRGITHESVAGARDMRPKKRFTPDVGNG